MQFHHHGYVSTDPRIQEVAGCGIDRPAEIPEEVDVLIVGTGPAGMILGAQLSQFPDITTRIVEKRPERLAIGQADGVACRSVETFQAFGFADDLIREAYRITESVFWGPDPHDRNNLVRTARTKDDPHGISEFPHLICNQARVQDKFAEVMENSPTRMTPDFGLKFVDLTVADEGDYPVTVTLNRTAGEREGDDLTVRAKYVVGCDGARSNVRRSIGRTLDGDSADHAWGVMDILAVTDFPDIRTKGLITSNEGGNILLIPREGGHLFRLYVDLGVMSGKDSAAIRQTTPEESIAIAQRIFHPYTLDVKHVAWYSVYEVGQRVTDHFDDVPNDMIGRRTPRVFITGDACHTHSAKAGQGMNVSMQDGFNLGWKLASVLRGLAPESLLDTYSGERQPVAQKLIDFDKEWSRMMGAKPMDPEHPELGGVDPEEFQNFYVQTFDFIMGFSTEYELAPLTASADHQNLAGGFPLGRRFHSAPVVRVSDANPIHLGHHATADGRWRIYAFADTRVPGGKSAVADWADWMAEAAESPVNRYTPEGAETDAVFDVKVVYQGDHTEFDAIDAPEIFLPRRTPFDLIDYEKVFATDPSDDIFDARGIDRSGAVVVVRPDMYVSAVVPLSEPDKLAAYFDTIMLPQTAAAPAHA
ncbi:FAD-binding monooxygenase [Spelaeicoccus albus]|uniref:Phenol 2-monooxygenase n=1 Tax=Spelaeicoccus albus TaxID=1280376 RepID=A0A7Z0IH85_9MICO|nr:FAD-binding monooxygenase [Spelaeicoccus albus]NYI67608.1 phenol 2-monooxygenase [Spelaeicoccus albus]